MAVVAGLDWGCGASVGPGPMVLPGRGAHRLQPAQRNSDSGRRKSVLVPSADWLVATVAKPSSENVSGQRTGEHLVGAVAQVQRMPLARHRIPDIDAISAGDVVGMQCHRRTPVVMSLLLLLAVSKVLTSRVARSTRAIEKPAERSEGRP